MADSPDLPALIAEVRRLDAEAPPEKRVPAYVFERLRTAAPLLADECERLRALLESEARGYFDIVFDGPPSHESGRFVEVEDERGYSFNAGEWIERPERGTWVLRIKRATAAGAECSRLQERVRVLEEALRGIRACALDQRRMHEVNRDGIECTGRLDAIEHYVWAALEGIE